MSLLRYNSFFLFFHTGTSPDSHLVVLQEYRKVMVLVERVFRGMKSPKPIQLDSASYKPDYVLISKDKEHLYLESDVKLSEKRILPRTTNFSPLFAELIKQQMKAKGVAVDEEPQLTLRYNLTNVKNYKVAEEGETPTVKLRFTLDESCSLFPKPEDAETLRDNNALRADS